MHRLSWSRWHACFFALLCWFSTPVISEADSADAVRQVTVQPQDNGCALVNPGMGWTLHFYSNFIENYGSKLEPADTLDDWPGLSVVYLRVPWSFLEPQEGKFNWSLFDTPTQRWTAKGKKIGIRVTCCESWWRYATPKWVQDAGAKGTRLRIRQRSTLGWSAVGAELPRSRVSERSWTISSLPWPGITTAIRTWHSSTSARSACGAKGTRASAANSARPRPTKW